MSKQPSAGAVGRPTPRGGSGGRESPGLLPWALPEGVADGDVAGGLGLVAQRAGVVVLVVEHLLCADGQRDAGAAEVAVDDPRAAPALGDRGDDQRLPDPGVAAGEDALEQGSVDGRAHVAAAVEVYAELLD